MTFLGQVTSPSSVCCKAAHACGALTSSLVLQSAAPRLLTIVALISFLVGLILAFVGAVQLRQFAHKMYVADLVGIAMAREMGE